MKNIREKIEQGYIHIRAIIEVVGKPKDHVKASLNEYLKKIKKDFELLEETIEPPKEQHNFFSAFAEIELLVEGVDSLISFSFDYMPSSIEILDPETLVVNNNILSGFLNDLQARLHALNTGLIQARDSNAHYIKNTAVLLRNFIVVLLSSREMTLKQLESYLGIKPDDIEKVIGVLIKEGKVKKVQDKYKAIPK